jgi:protocatechuate 3,4-dioxygenase beta subunit
MWWTALPLLWSLIWGPPAVSRTVAGLVVDARGKPVPAAQVELLRSREPGALPALAEDGLYQAATGADGRFEIPLVPPGRFDLLVQGSGFVPLEHVGLEVPDGKGAVDLGRFALERGTVLSLRVIDPRGQPLEGAEAWVVPRDPRDWNDYYRYGPAAVSGPEGELDLPDLPPGRSVSLDVCRSGYLPASFVVREVPGEPVEAVLEPAARISGRVVNPAGAPVEGARLAAWLSGESPERPQSLRPCMRDAGSTRADGEGGFTLESLPPGWWIVRASANGWLPAETERRQVRGGEHLVGMEIVLGQGAVVAGRVLSPDGAPMAGAQVQVLGERSGPATVSGADGAYRLEGVATGERTVEATHPEHEFAGRTLEVTPGENRLDLKLERDRRRDIRGRVLSPDGAPVAGARVLGPSSSAWSMADGSFTLRERDGRHEVWAQAEGYAPAQTAVAVEGGPVGGVEVRLSRGGSLRGRLLGLDREGLAGATVETALPPLLQRRNAVDAQGGWRIAGLPPGTWEVTARVGGRSVTERTELAPDQEEAVLDLHFPPVFEVSGRVLDPDGQPVADATVRLFTAGSGGWGFTRSDGSFRIEVEEGAYRGFALKQGYLSARLEEPVQVEGGPVEGLELILGRGTALRGRILGLEPGERAREIWAEGPGGAIRLGELDQEAQYAVFGLVPGEWKVKASFEGKETVSWITVEEGQEEAFLDLAFGEASVDEQPGQ